MSYYLDFYGTPSLDGKSQGSLYSIPLGYPIPNFSTQSKIYDLLIPFFQNEPVKDDLRSSRVVRCLKISTSIGAVLARIPLIPLSLNFEQEVKGVGITCAVFNMISFSSYLAWSSKDMIDHVFYGLKTLENGSIKSCDRCKTIGFIALSLISGLASQVPYLFLAYKYNPENKGMVFLSALDVIPPVYSIYLLLHQTFKKSICSHAAQKILRAKKFLLERLDLRLQEIIDGKIDTSEFELMLNSEMSIQDSMNYFFQDLISDPLDAGHINPCIHFSKLKAAQFLGFFLIVTQLFWTGFLSYQGVNQLTSNKAALSVIFIYVIISNLALTRFVMVGSIYKVINSMTFYCMRDRSYNYISERLKPRLSFFLSAFVLAMASASFVPALTLSYDFLDQRFFLYSAIPYGLALITMNYLPLKNLVNTSICYGINRFGTEDEKKEVKIYDHYKSVKKIIENSSYESLGLLMLKMSELPIFVQIMNRFSISLDELLALKIGS
jgi:hypothetical protein